MERARTRLLLLAILCGVVMLLLSFSSWVHFSTIEYSETVGEPVNPVSIHLGGYETSRSRDQEELLQGDVLEEEKWCSCRVSFGDGYITAVLGVLVIIASAGAIATNRERPFAMALIGASIGSFLLAGYNALGEWHAIAWTQLGQTEFVDGTIEPGLWALVVVSTLVALLGAALWTIARVEDEDAWYEEQLEGEATEDMNPLVLDPRGNGPGET